jgi:hypothetical protein
MAITIPKKLRFKTHEVLFGLRINSRQSAAWAVSARNTRGKQTSATDPQRYKLVLLEIFTKVQQQEQRQQQQGVGFGLRASEVEESSKCLTMG